MRLISTFIHKSIKFFRRGCQNFIKRVKRNNLRKIIFPWNYFQLYSLFRISNNFYLNFWPLFVVWLLKLHSKCQKNNLKKLLFGKLIFVGFFCYIDFCEKLLAGLSKPHSSGPTEQFEEKLFVWIGCAFVFLCGNQAKTFQTEACFFGWVVKTTCKIKVPKGTFLRKFFRERKLFAQNVAKSEGSVD